MPIKIIKRSGKVIESKSEKAKMPYTGKTEQTKEAWPSKEYCNRCGGCRWQVGSRVGQYCADPLCSGVYVVSGQAEGNKVSILPLPERGYWPEDKRRELADANAVPGMDRGVA